MIFGMYSGTYVTNQDGSGTIFQQYNPGFSTPTSAAANTSLTMGLISVPSGNAITSLYDYRVGDNSSQTVMFTQGKNLNFFELNNPSKIYNINSSGISDDNSKYSHATFQNLLFSASYSQSSGSVWDQFYINPSGNWTQPHGLQPSFDGSFASLPIIPTSTQVINSSGIVVTGVFSSPGIPSGSSYSIVLATALDSGGYRSSNVIPFSGSTGNVLQLSGTQGQSDGTYPYDILHTPGLASMGQSQYHFDVNSLRYVRICHSKYWINK